MPAPATSSEVIQLLERSGLTDPASLQNILKEIQLNGAYPEPPAKFCDVLIERKVITRFHADQLLAGRHRGFFVGKYKVLELIGQGGMGKVYLAEHKIMRRQVALKILPKTKSADPAALARFQREARAVATLNHRNIVQAYDIDREGDLHYLVMEYVDGMSVQEYVKRYGPIPWAQACDYARQSAEGLHHAHQLGLIHRDVKPGNLLIDTTGTIKLLDLGLAVFFEEKDLDPLTLAYEENVLGTADYLSPEQALDSHNVDIRADIYSLGGTIYYMITGGPPFPEGTIAQKLLWHQTKTPRPIKELRPELPDELATIIGKMMSKRPEDRYSNPQELADVIAPFAQRIDNPFDGKMIRDRLYSPPSSVKKNSVTSGSPAPSAVSSPLNAARSAEDSSIPVFGLPAAPAVAAPTSLDVPSAPVAPVASAPVTPTPRSAPQKHAPASSLGAPTQSQRAPAAPRPPTAPITGGFVPPVASPASGRVGTAPLSAPVQAEVAGSPASMPPFDDPFGSSLWPGSATGASPETPPNPPPSTTTVKSLTVWAAKPAAIWATFDSKQRKIVVGAIVGVLVAALAGIGWQATQKRPIPKTTQSAPTPEPQTLAGLFSDPTRKTKVIQLRYSKASEWRSPTIRLGAGGIPADDLTLAGEQLQIPIAIKLDGAGPLFVLDSVRGLAIRDFVIDGGGQKGPLIELRGNLPDLKIQTLTFRNFKGPAIRFVGAEGSASKPIRLERLRFEATDKSSPVLLFDNAPSAFVDMDDFLIEGEFRAGLEFASPFRDINFSRSQIKSGQAGLILSAPNADWKQLKFVNNQLDKMGVGVLSLVGPDPLKILDEAIKTNVLSDIPIPTQVETKP